jgi:hypothetical protein
MALNYYCAKCHRLCKFDDNTGTFTISVETASSFVNNGNDHDEIMLKFKENAVLTDEDIVKNQLTHEIMSTYSNAMEPFASFLTKHVVWSNLHLLMTYLSNKSMIKLSQLNSQPQIQNFSFREYVVKNIISIIQPNRLSDVFAILNDDFGIDYFVVKLNYFTHLEFMYAKKFFDVLPELLELGFTFSGEPIERMKTGSLIMEQSDEIIQHLIDNGLNLLYNLKTYGIMRYHIDKCLRFYPNPEFIAEIILGKFNGIQSLEYLVEAYNVDLSSVVKTMKK